MGSGRTETVATRGRTDEKWAERRDWGLFLGAACLGIAGAALGIWLTVVAMVLVAIGPVRRLDRRYHSALAPPRSREEADEGLRPDD